MKAQICLVLCLLMLHLPFAHARPHQAIDSIDALDEQIGICLEYLAAGKLHEAGLLSRQMAWRFPDFELGHLISAEMDMVSALHDVSIVGQAPLSITISELLLEAQKRLTSRRHSNSGLSEHPSDLIQAGTHLSHLLVADLNASTLTQYNVSLPQAVLVRQHYIGSGEGGYGKRVEGDLKTPLGVYRINGFRSDESLPDLYGSGALTLDYPNALDRFLGRTGYGIWLHGVPSARRSRSPYSSEGCVTMSNEHLSRLSRELDASNTAVILTNQAAPLRSEERYALQETFRELFRSYQKTQIAGNRSQSDASGTDKPEVKPVSLRNRPSDALRIRVNEQLRLDKAFADIRPDDISIFRHPDIISNTSEFQAFMLTEAIFGSQNEYKISVYWAQDASDRWQVLTETLDGPGM